MGKGPDDFGITDPDELEAQAEAQAEADEAEHLEAARARADAELADRLAELARNRLGALAGPAFDRMRARRDGTDRPVPLPSRWEATSAELRGGLWAGCWILIGGTGVGKSQWAFEVAYNAAVRERVPVAYVGLELDAAGLVARLAALGLHYRHPATSTGQPQRVPWSGLYLGDSEALGWFEPGAKGADVLAELNTAPFYLVSGEARGDAFDGWGYRKIAELAADLRAKHPDGPALLVVDFLQLVGGDPARREELRERIGNAAYAGRMAARKHGLSVLLLSATARNYYHLFAGRKVGKDGVEAKGEELGTGDPGRFLGTGKESGETEFAADGVLALCRAPWPKGEQPPPVWLAVAKARTGRGPAGGWIRYTFDGTTFEEPSDRAADLASGPRVRV